MSQTALVLGSTGRFGRHAAIAFEAAGWRVRRFARGAGDLDQAASGADVIVNGWNPAYPDWSRDLPSLTRSVIKAARHSGATVILPGNVYVFGAQTPLPWSEHSPHHATNPLGRLRIEMEAAYAASGVRTILLRAGDFIDTEASGNWFDMVMIKRLDRGVFTYPGRADIPHAFAYLPDVARAAVDLAERRDALPVFSDIPYPGYTLSGQDLCTALEQILKRPLRLKPMSYLPLQLARPFWRLAARLLEMRYLWQSPNTLEDRAFRAILPAFRETPLREALIRATGRASGQYKIDPDQTVTARA